MKLLFPIFIFMLSFFILSLGRADAQGMMFHFNIHRHVMHVAPVQIMHIQKRIESVNGSGVEGIVDLVQLPRQGGTHITVIGFGLQPSNQYISLYYDNHVCNLEPYSADDVIGGIYAANNGDVGVTHGNQSDNLDKINSVSIRNASNFQLLACANIHP